MKLLELLKKELPVLKQAAKEDLQNLDKTAKDVIEKAKETVEEAKMFYEAVKVGFLAAYMMSKPNQRPITVKEMLKKEDKQ